MITLTHLAYMLFIFKSQFGLVYTGILKILIKFATESSATIIIVGNIFFVVGRFVFIFLILFGSIRTVAFFTGKIFTKELDAIFK